MKYILDLSIERKIYFGILVAIAILATFDIFTESVETEKTLDGTQRKSRILGPGWSSLSRKQDIADFEWTFWFSDLRESIIWALVGHVIISLVCAFYFPTVKHVLQAAYCIYCVRVAFGHALILINILICLLFCATATKKLKSLCWQLTVAIILLLHFDGFYMQILPSILSINTSYIPIAYVGLGFTTLRCASYAFEVLGEGKTNSPSGIIGLLQYNFYLPYFFFGPIMTYDVYSRKVVTTPPKDHLLEMFKEGLKTVLGIMVVDFLLHFVHVSSVANDAEYLNSAPAYVVGFLLFANVLLDWMKAWALYRITSNISKVVDGYTDAPEGPPCLARICTFADTYFDRSIQHWVCRYIYDPIGKKHTSLTKETIASCVTFLFVAIWQGPGIQVIVWAILNCMGLTFEFFIAKLTPTEDKEKKRLAAFFLGINYWCILLFNVVGINGMETAFIAAKIIFFRNFWNIAVSLLLSYCYVALITLPNAKEKNVKKIQ